MRTIGPSLCFVRLSPLAGCAWRSRGTAPRELSAGQFLGNLTRHLPLLAVPRSHEFSLKAFRAGHATELVREGASWAKLLEAGEWRGSASLRYVDPNAVHAASFTPCLSDASSEEDPEP